MQTSMLTAANRGVGRYGWLLGLGLGALVAGFVLNSLPPSQPPPRPPLPRRMMRNLRFMPSRLLGGKGKPTLRPRPGWPMRVRLSPATTRPILAPSTINCVLRICAVRATLAPLQPRSTQPRIRPVLSLSTTRFRLRTFASARMTSTKRYLATKPRLRCPLALPIGAVRPK